MSVREFPAPSAGQVDDIKAAERSDEAAVPRGQSVRIPATQPNPKAAQRLPGQTGQPHPNVSPRLPEDPPGFDGASSRLGALREALRRRKTFHFVGIGGTGMSALADQLLARGCRVTGTDLAAGETVERLRSRGARVVIGHSAAALAGADLLVYSSAVRADNPELAGARERGIPIYHRSELLAALMAEAESIAVAGTHGKSTTTALLAHLLAGCGEDPRALVGADVAEWGGNSRRGGGRYLVAEADESDRSFLRLPVNHAVVTNVDWDHPDTYSSRRAVAEAFNAFLAQVPADGIVAWNADDPTSAELAGAIRGRSVSYGFGPAADYRVEILESSAAGSRFLLHRKGASSPGEFFLPLLGRHNVENAAGALALAFELGAGADPLRRALASFRGLRRRLERLGERGGVVVVDDYGHHPAEVAANLAALALLGRRLVLVFQPHRYTRTAALAEAFAASFTAADALFVADIYPAGEAPIPGIDLEWFVAAVERVREVAGHGDLDRVFELVRRELRPGDLLVTMGAGDVWRLARRYLDG
ncbi:MAG: UDP-N-acetylmuramate--L-alanine ligase [Acidobacteriota bacterium]